MNANHLQPAFLHPGDRVALIAPSYFLEGDTVNKAADAIRSWGFEPVVGKNVGKQWLHQYAGSVEERLSDLVWAYEDDTIRGILCTRGGYGTIQLLEHIPDSLYYLHPKWLIGYSDITSLHAQSVVSGSMSIHGAMGAQLVKHHLHGPTCQLLRDLLMGKIPQYALSPLPYDQTGTGSGILVGCPAPTFSPLISTKYDFLQYPEIILFIEEVEESAHHIDRMFHLLRLHGIMPHIKGIMMGDFTACGDEYRLGSIEKMLSYYTRELNIPVITAFPAGHGNINLPLIEGAWTTLRVTEQGSTVSFDMEGDKNIVHIEDENGKRIVR